MHLKKWVNGEYKVSVQVSMEKLFLKKDIVWSLGEMPEWLATWMQELSAPKGIQSEWSARWVWTLGCGPFRAGRQLVSRAEMGRDACQALEGRSLKETQRCLIEVDTREESLDF